MTGPGVRLAGPRLALVPVPGAVAVAVTAGTDVAPALRPLGLTAAPGWPHEGSAAQLRGEGDGAWLVVRDAVVVGDCGWAGPPDEDGAVELAYGLAAASRRQGLGTEAVAVLAAWSELQPGVELLCARVLPGNEASLRLLARLGFREHGSHPPHLRLVRAAPGRARPRGRHVC